MSAIIKFPLERVQRTTVNKMSDRKTAQILLFEGVRYQQGEGSPKPGKRKKQVGSASKTRN